MSTPPNPDFEISAQYLGPVFSLNCRLSKANQNLIFARNGTGKSFLSRAFRYFDQHQRGVLPANAAVNLISEESPNGKGALTIKRGDTELGSLELTMGENDPKVQIDNTIFHVFSEDFVQEELRAHQFELDGNITNQITVDSGNIEINEAQKSLQQTISQAGKALADLIADFENDRVAQLIDALKINKNLAAYASLSFGSLLSKYTDKPDPPEKSVARIQADLDALKAIPTNPDYPGRVDEVRFDDANLDAIKASLGKITSPSSVSKVIKSKIDTHREFYKSGIEIIEKEEPSSCPFCEQSLSSADPKNVIDAYLAYFNEAEEKHKDELRVLYAALNKKEVELSSILSSMKQQKACYDTLKNNLASMKDTSLKLVDGAIASVSASISSCKAKVETKAENVGTSHPLPINNLEEQVAAINRIVSENNASAAVLTKAIQKSDNERKNLQRNACGAFELEFAILRWPAIEKLRVLEQAEKQKRLEIETLERSGPSQQARDRVADTFELLLKEFFGEKYVFDRTAFVLRRGARPMTRGPFRTLSDGEKTAIAFCYFVACTHKKVTANGDYSRLFFVFDDPITSMSYDFVFTIAQVLRNLTISDQGVLALDPKLSANNIAYRPKLLILTHSSYFFNIMQSNRVVQSKSCFELTGGEQQHKLNSLNKYLAPFLQQLRDVYGVASGDDPDHTTGNSTRSVLEAIGRFCWPNKSDDLSQFLKHLVEQDDLVVSQVLVNSLSHGTYGDEIPSPDVLRQACNEVLEVVRKYAPGQLWEIERSSA